MTDVGPRLVEIVASEAIVTIGRRAIVWNLMQASTLTGIASRHHFRVADHIRCRLDLGWADLIEHERAA